MPMERMPMRHVRDCVRLKNAGMSTREIARPVGVAPSTVRLTLDRCAAAGVTWALEADLTDAILEQRLFTNVGVKPGPTPISRPSNGHSAPASPKRWGCASIDQSAGLVARKTHGTITTRVSCFCARSPGAMPSNSPSSA